MIKAKLSNGTMVLGLSAGNLTKLSAGLPIIFDGRPFGCPGDVIILYGETEDDIAKYLMNQTGVESSDQAPRGSRNL